MSKPILTVITACSRPANLPGVQSSLRQLDSTFEVRWVVVMDANVASRNQVTVEPTVLVSEPTDCEGIRQKNKGIELTDKDSWVYFLDDDNTIHPNFAKTANAAIYNYQDKMVFVFQQQNKDGSHRLFAGPVEFGKIDVGSFLIHASAIGETRFKPFPGARADDFVFISEVYAKARSTFQFITEYATYHNGLFRIADTQVGRKRVYLYWEGERRHWYYDLCLETIMYHNPTAQVLSRKHVEEVVGRFPSELASVYITHQVDWIRKAFIAAVGGLWLDMDFICFQSLQSLANLADDFDYVGYKEWSGNWMDNFFVGRPGSQFLLTAAEYALDQMRQHGKDMPWLSASADAISHAFGHHNWCNHIHVPTHLISPVSVMDSNWFTRQMDESDDLHAFRSFGFMTSFHGLRSWLQSQTSAQFRGGRSRLAGLFRRALN